jgi:dTDP-N-acetylfucosamine:lipid II N-acetylfucosaminyltransferase
MNRTLKIFHIAEDEKFINSAVAQFENCFPECNTFYVLPISINEKFIHVAPKDFIHSTTVKELENLKIPQNALVVLHSLSPSFFDFVLQLHNSVKIIWFCFGFEVYDDANYFKDNALLDTLTLEKFPNFSQTKKNRIIEFLRPFYRIVKPSLPLSKREVKHEIFKRVNFFGCPFLEEYQSINKLLGIKKPFLNFWYYPLEIITDIHKPIVFPKANIIIGNSGYKTGNHLDVFDKIKNFPLDDKDVIVPLNYGEQKYIQEVLIEGKKDFNGAFISLLDFMPLQNYNTILESVGVAILNNKRQQAVGNTIALLWFGAKVFLSHSNPFYLYLKRIGIHLYCYETELNSESGTQFLSLKEIEHNRKLLFKELNKAHLANLLKEQILKIHV